MSSTTVADIQGQIKGCMAAQGVDIKELARRVRRRPATVRKLLEGPDLMTGEIVAMAHVLGMRWVAVLENAA